MLTIINIMFSHPQFHPQLMSKTLNNKIHYKLVQNN